MKKTKVTFLILTALIIAACSSTRKNTTSAAASTGTAMAPTSTTSLVLLKPADGIYAPGNDELAAIQTQYKEVTLEQLQQGHRIYTQGACVGCHGTANIYQYGEAQWKTIMDDMAQRAEISETEKNAVYKYVLAIKATQPK